MNGHELLTLMAALDKGTNMFGTLSPEVRSRLFAVVSDPSETTWSDAHSIMINNGRFLTLWQACLRYTEYNVTSRPSDTDWPAIPNAQQLMTALVAGLG